MKVLVVALLISGFAFAQQSGGTSTLEANTKSVEAIAKEGKKERKKKAEMCNDCGKPETECDCEGHKNEE